MHPKLLRNYKKIDELSIKHADQEKLVGNKSTSDNRTAAGNGGGGSAEAIARVRNQT